MPAEPTKKKRRIRASNETVREKTAKARDEASKSKPEKPKRHTLRRVFAPLATIWRPVAWLGRHVVPRYIRDSFKELRNITWPSRKQSRQLTGAVIIFAIVFGALVSSLDYGLDKIFKKVFLHE